MNENYFAELYAVNVNEHTEKKNGLTYLSWAWAWAEIKKRHPDAIYTIYETPEGCNYFTDGRTCWVKTGVTLNGIEHIEMLPVMDLRNKSIAFENVTSMDVNKAIQRSLTKACARHGLGLYIYAGEDLPDVPPDPIFCEECKIQIEGRPDWPPEKIAEYSRRRFKRTLCPDCQKAAMKKEPDGGELRFGTNEAV